MNRISAVALGTLLSCLIAGAAAAQDCQPNCSLTASRYLVRTDCTGLNAEQNCFESLADLTGVWTGSGPPEHPVPGSCSGCSTGWLWTDRMPSASDPVTVEIGPGAFDPLICPENNGSGSPFGHVYFRGSGIDTTRIGITAGQTQSTGIRMYDCDEMHVSDLTAQGSVTGVGWTGGGSGLWERVNMLAVADGTDAYIAGWSDDCSVFGAAELSYHVLKQVTSAAHQPEANVANQTVGYSSHCAKTWFLGGSIIARSGGLLPKVRGLWVLPYTSRGSDFSLFNSKIDAQIEKSVGGTSTGISLEYYQSSQPEVGPPAAALDGVSIVARGAVGETTAADANGIVGASFVGIKIDTTIEVEASGTATEEQ